MKPTSRHYVALVLMGAIWGITPILGKIVMSAGHRPFGILLWTVVLAAVLSGAATYARGKRLPIRWDVFPLYLGISLLGQVIPHWMTYTAVGELPAGIVSILLAVVPMFALPIALGLKLENFNVIRFIGILVGAISVVMIVAPDTSLPDPTKAGFVLLVLVAALAYGGEGNYLIWYGNKGLDSMQILFGSSIISLIIVVPLTLMTGQMISPFQIWDSTHYLIVFSGLISWATYVSYIWLIGQAGPVFASQVAYLVTAFGVGWSMLILAETYSIWIWMAFVLMMVGISLVQPRESKRRTAT